MALTNKTNDADKLAQPLEKLDPKAMIHTTTGGVLIDPTDSDNLREFGPKPELVGEDTLWMRAQVKFGKLKVIKDK